MTYLDLDIAFKQTTSENIRCKFCSKSVEGEDGYIKLNLEYRSGRWINYKRIVACNFCFQKWIDKVTTATANKKERYNKLVKTKILKSLK